MNGNTNKFRNCQKGSTAVEYGLVGALIVVAIVGSVQLLGSNTQDLHEYVSDSAAAAMNP